MSRTYTLSKHKSANCHVKAYDDGLIEFISYTTLVIKATPTHMYEPLNGGDIIVPSNFNPENDAYALRCYGTFTQTASRQITWFLDEYFPDVDKKIIKKIAGTDDVVLANKKYRG